MIHPPTAEASASTLSLAGIIAELRRLIERPDSTVYPSLGSPKIHYVSAAKLAEVVDRLEVETQVLATAVHTLQVVSRARKLRTTNSLLDEYEDSIDSLAVKVNELEQSRDRWIELAEWAATQYLPLKAEIDRLELELVHSRKVSELRGDCIESYAAAINDQALRIHELEERVEDLQLHPDRPSATPRKPTPIQRIRRLFHA